RRGVARSRIPRSARDDNARARHAAKGLRGMTLALRGVRVLDFLWAGAGAWGSRYLASYGAEVIRIEWKGHPDRMRYGPPYWPMPDGSLPQTMADKGNRGAHFQNVNPGKYSIGLNMRHPEGKALFRRLLPLADVVADNFTPTVM